MPERFFILGCQRTGTTLMRLILESHPDVFCYDEIKGYKVLQGFSAEPPSQAALVGFKIPCWTEQLTQQVLIDEGADGPCKNFYRGEKIIFMHRDVRDTIASMLKLKAGGSNWCELWVSRIINAKVARDPTFRTRHASELEIIESGKNRLVGLAALYWKYKTESALVYREKGFPVLTVSYENLVVAPRESLQKVCAHLDIPFHHDLLRHQDMAHTELFENGMTLGNTDPGKPIQVDSVGQWGRFLSDEDLDTIRRVSGALAVRMAAFAI